MIVQDSSPEAMRKYLDAAEAKGLDPSLIRLVQDGVEIPDAIAKGKGESTEKSAKSEPAEEPTKADLTARAAELDIEGRSSMTKDDLAKAIRKAERG